MDSVEFEDIGLINGSTTFGTDILTGSQPIVYTQDLPTPLSSDDLSVYGNRVTYVSIPIHIVQDSQNLFSGYLIDNSQIPVMNRQVILTEDNLLQLVETSAQSQPVNQDLITKQLLSFESPTANFISSLDIDKVLGSCRSESGQQKSFKLVSNKTGGGRPRVAEVNKQGKLSSTSCKSSGAARKVGVTEIVDGALSRTTDVVAVDINKILRPCRIDFVDANKVLRVCRDDTAAKAAALIGNIVHEELLESPQDLISLSDIEQPLDGTGSMICQPCGVRFTSGKLFKRHKDAHRNDKPYVCKHCSESFNYESNLKLHLALHNINNPFCPECKKTFSRVASLKAHLMLHEREESLFCSVCGDEFNHVASLEDHMNEHKAGASPAPEVYRCLKCNIIFTTGAELKEHSKEHRKGKVIKRPKKRKRGAHVCDFCLKSFQKPSQLARHKRIHTGEKPFKCDLCSRGFSQKGSLQIHMLKHNGVRPFVCEFCQSAFTQKGNLQAHVQRLHIATSNDRVHSCDQCSCVFRKLGSLNAHITRVHGLPPQQESLLRTIQTKIDSPEACDNPSTKDSSDKENEGNFSKLSQKLVTITNLLEDGSVHKQTVQQRRVDNIVWHQCSYCSVDFKTPSDLVRHLRIHTREKPYKCKLCFRAFALRSTLNGHMRTHTGVKNFVCDICNKAFASQSSLNYHKKSHLKEKKDFDKVVQAPILIKNDIQLPSGNQEMPKDSILSLGNISVDLANCVSLPNNGVLSDENTDRTPDPERPYRCEFCLASFKRSSHLKVHVRTHTGERPFVCEDCGSAFVSSSVLKVHMTTHRNIKCYKCGECGKAFSCVASLRRHTETHAPGHAYACPICTKPYKSYASCSKHIASHTPPEGLQIKLRPVALEKQANKTLSIDENGMLSIISNSSDNVEEISEILPEDPKNDNATLQGDLCDLIQSLQPGQQFTFTANGMSEVPVNPQSVQNQEATVLPTQQDNTPEDNFGEFDEAVNQQLFGTLTGQKDPLFEQGLDSCVFLQNDQLEIGGTVIGTNLASILPPSNMHRCDECDSTFNSSVELTLHKSKHLQEKDVSQPCLPCRNGFSSSADLLEHLKAGSCQLTARENDMALASLISDAPIHSRCNKCDLDFTTAEELSNHLDFHIQMKEYTCSLCKINLGSLPDLQEHIKIHEETCKDPDEICLDEDQMINHNQIFESDREKNDVMIEKIVSKNSKKKGKRKRTVTRKLTEQEKKAVSSMEPDSASVFWKVLVQSLMEKERTELVSEVKQEYEAKAQVHANKCKYCPKSFRKPSDLVRHLRIHTGERPYKCPCCSKCFTVKSTASSHMKTHTKDRSYKCHICNKLFATTGSLKVHMRLHTGVKPFLCPFSHCDARFRTSGHKKAHLLTHVKQATHRSSAATSSSAKSNRKANARKSGGAGQRQAPSVPEEHTTGSLSRLMADSQIGLDPVIQKEDVLTIGSDPIIEETPSSEKYVISLPDKDDHQEIFGGKLSSNARYIVQAIDGSGGSIGIGDDLQSTGGTHFVVTFADDDTAAAVVQDSYEAVLQKSGVIGHSEDDQDALPFDETSKPPPEVIHDFDGDVNLEECRKDLLDEVLDKNNSGLQSCIFCPKHFMTESALKKHMKLHTMDVSMLEDTQLQDDKFTCENCKKTFTKQFIYEKHVKKCHKNHSCLDCQEKFSQRNDLELHMLEHALENVWICEGCEHAFPDESSLQTHKCEHKNSAAHGGSHLKQLVAESPALDLDSDVSDFFLFPPV